MRLPNEPDPPPQINVVPMIDVIFAILTFFIMSTLYLSRTEGLPVNLPQAATGITQEQTKIVVTITPQGELSLNKESIAIAQLEGKLRSLIGKNNQATVIINADKRVTHGRVIEVMDKVRLIPTAKIAIASQKP